MFIIESGFIFLIVGLSLLSGLGSFFQGRREGRLEGFWDFVSEATLAVIVGLVVGYICEANEFERLSTCALVLVLSNNGSDTLMALRGGFLSRLNQLFSFGGKHK